MEVLLWCNDYCEVSSEFAPFLAQISGTGQVLMHPLANPPACLTSSTTAGRSANGYNLPQGQVVQLARIQ
jgi:hypothetical protein